MTDDQLPIELVDLHDLLERLSRLQIGTWRYRWEGHATHHVGPLARDFAEAFGVHGDDRTIDPQDATGVALAGVQALNERLEELAERVTRLEAISERSARRRQTAIGAIGSRETSDEDGLDRPRTEGDPG